MELESPSSASAPEPEAAPAAGSTVMDDARDIYARSFRPSAADLATLMPVSGTVSAGDVLVIDTDMQGKLKLSGSFADPTVFGIVAAEPGVVLGAGQPGDRPSEEVPVTLSGVALCKVDAGFGSVRPGDLLTTSPTPGHAMRSDEPLPGTIIGKALEPLEHGTGLVRVLVTLR
jgi:hypothetical protein